MQLIMNTESTETEKMSTLEQESLIEKPLVNGALEINDVIKAVEDMETPIANKENIQVEESKIIKTEENGSPERILEVRDEDRAKVSVEDDDAAAANENCKEMIDSIKTDCPGNKNATENVMCEINGNESQNTVAQNNTVENGDVYDDDSVVKGVNSVNDTKSRDETNENILKQNRIAENIDANQETKVVVSEVKELNSKKETLQENLPEGTVSIHDTVNIDKSEDNLKRTKSSAEILAFDVEFSAACPNNEKQPVIQEIAQNIVKSEDAISFTSDNNEFIEPVAVCLYASEIKRSENESREVVKEISEHGGLTEVIIVEKITSAQITVDVERVSEDAEFEGNDAEVNIENKSNSAQISDDVEMVCLDSKNKGDADIQCITKIDDSEIENTAICENVTNLVDKNKDDGYSQEITESVVSQNENENISASTNSAKINSVGSQNNAIDIQVTAEMTTASQTENKDNDTRTSDDIVDLDEVKIVEDNSKKHLNDNKEIPSIAQKVEENKKRTSTIRLSNTLDILSDDDEEPIKASSPEPSKVDNGKVASQEVSGKCINLDDDDDIMLIDDVTSSNDKKENPKVTAKSEKNDFDPEPINSKQIEGNNTCNKDPVVPEKSTISKPLKQQNKGENTEEQFAKPKPLIPDNFFKTFRKNLAEMTRDDLEEFCILKIVESVIERSNLNDIKSKVKTMTLGLEEYKKKSVMVAKQNRDLQVVLKSIQEELKKKSGTAITPLKITRSVGMQVVMPDKNKRKGMGQNAGVNPNANVQTSVNNNINRPQKTTNQNQRPQKPASTQQSIPVPRLVPATNNNVTNKPAQTTTTNNAKASTPTPNGAKTSPPLQKTAEKRTHSRTQSDTVDLTDDEPPVKQMPKSSPVPPVRLVPSQNLMSARQQFTQNSPRKVYIPISGPQAQNIRPGQAVVLKSVPPSPAPRPTKPPMVRMPQSPVRAGRGSNSNRHPAPLPDAMKQYQPPNWKAIPPAPDLKLSKVENGIVISWKIDGYQEDSYEEIASYQLYAYQETPSPPNTALWKKIGDVKALPLPMACTLTQFMAGYKYYFAVRAVDVRSRVGPFSLPGSILLLNKM